MTAGNVIYTIGGFNGNQFLNSIELLEAEAVGWRNWQQTGNNDLLEIDELDEEQISQSSHLPKTVAASS